MLHLHVGLHKTGTTYFQGEVFPHWNGLKYLRNLSVEGFLKIDQAQPCLASREGFSGGVVAHQDEKLTFLRRLNAMFPEARILISLRRHGPYLNAIYSQFLRYGGTLEPGEFFDFETDSGYMKQADLEFRAYIDGIATLWGQQPFVFLLEELKEDRPRLFREMGDFIGVKAPDLDKRVSSGRSNVSLGRRQAELLRKINRLSGVGLHRDGSTRPYRILRRFHLDPPGLCQRWSAMGKSETIFSSVEIERINCHYADDWDYVRSQVDSRMKHCPV